jgi:hypothetical protein
MCSAIIQNISGTNTKKNNKRSSYDEFDEDIVRKSRKHKK